GRDSTAGSAVPRERVAARGLAMNWARKASSLASLSISASTVSGASLLDTWNSPGFGANGRAPSLAAARSLVRPPPAPACFFAGPDPGRHSGERNETVATCGHPVRAG